MKKTIEVVAAVIKKDNKYFCAQRKNSGELAKKWEFPGGKIEKNESQKEALKRELEEELDLNVEIKEHLITVRHEYDTFKIILHAFLCETDKKDIVLNEHLDSKWLYKEELDILDWAEADIPIVELIKRG